MWWFTDVPGVVAVIRLPVTAYTSALAVDYGSLVTRAKRRINIMAAKGGEIRWLMISRLS